MLGKSDLAAIDMGEKMAGGPCDGKTGGKQQHDVAAGKAAQCPALSWSGDRQEQQPRQQSQYK